MGSVKLVWSFGFSFENVNIELSLKVNVSSQFNMMQSFLNNKNTDTIVLNQNELFK